MAACHSADLSINTCAIRCGSLTQDQGLECSAATRGFMTACHSGGTSARISIAG